MGQEINILTEVGDEIGFGHFVRCSAIKKVLEANGFNVFMYVYCNNYDLSEEGSIFKHDWIKKRTQISDLFAGSVVIIDSYIATSSLYQFYSKKCNVLIAIDDYNRIAYKSDYIINPNVYFDDIDYSNQSAKCLGGRDYVILRETFRKNTKSKTSSPEIKTVLVTLGGTDFRKILNKVSRTLSNINFIEKVIFVVPSLKEQSAIFCDNRFRILGGQTDVNIKSLMLNSDIVLSACGQTLHELASLGQSVIAICLDKDQLLNQDYYFRKNFLRDKIFWNDSDLEFKIQSQILQINLDKKKLKKAKPYKGLIDKNGVCNILNLLKEIS